MELSEVKNYLRIDFDDDDSMVQMTYDAAKEYVEGAVGKCDETSARVKMVILAVTSHFYENRTVTMEKNSTSKVFDNMLLQLRYENIEEGDSDG